MSRMFAPNHAMRGELPEVREAFVRLGAYGGFAVSYGSSNRYWSVAFYPVGAAKAETRRVYGATLLDALCAAVEAVDRAGSLG